MLAPYLWLLYMNETFSSILGILMKIPISYQIQHLKLKQVRLPSNTGLFFMKIIFIHSHKTIGELLHSNFYKIIIILDINLSERICFKIGIYILYTLLTNVCKFHKGRTSSLAILIEVKMSQSLIIFCHMEY